jgi:hypothetical protein
MAKCSFFNKRNTQDIQILKSNADWLLEMLPQLSIHNEKQITLQQVKESYEAAGLEDFELFWDNKPMNTLWQSGLLML